MICLCCFYHAETQSTGNMRRHSLMRRTAMNAVLRMVRECLNGNINEMDFRLDFPYEIEKRYWKMCREDADHADLIYYDPVGNGTDLYRSMTTSRSNTIMSWMAHPEFSIPAAIGGRDFFMAQYRVLFSKKKQACAAWAGVSCSAHAASA